MGAIKNGTKNSLHYIKVLLKWVLISMIVGIIGGVLGSIFHECIAYVTNLRSENNWIIYLIPIGGLVIVTLYSLVHKKVDTNLVIESIQTEKDVPWYMAPLIFIGTVITHLFGGSAGREGAALQLGGSIGYNLGKLFKLNKNDTHVIIMAGMSAVFAAMFGTPITASFFALEVTSVGIMYYAALLPCVIASICAKEISLMFGITPVSFIIENVPGFNFFMITKIAFLAILCALVCILFCYSMKCCEKLSEKYIKNNYLRVFIGGVIIVLLTLLVGNNDYNGAGMNIVSDAISGNAKPEAFILKILFTVITLSAGFKGGEIVPSFFIGSTFGCVIGSYLGIPPGFAAGIGLVALFCGLVNCPVTSLLLAVELFGVTGIEYFVLACALSYMMSGYCGLYKSQKIIYSKLDTNILN